MNNWILLIIIYAVFVSLTEMSKKKAMKKNNVYEVLAWFTFISFIFTFLITKDAFVINYKYLPIIFFKSSIVVVAWLLGLKALDGLELSIYGLVKITRIIFSVLLSCIILSEKITIPSLIGMVVIITGLVLVNTTTKKTEVEKKNSFILILLFLISCFLSSVSAIVDKKALVHITSGQMQFWFMFFLTIYYFIFLLIKEKKIDFKVVKNNYWLILIAIFLVVGDRFLFIANSISSSKVIIMSLLKQLSVVFSIILGKIVFDEKDIIKKLLYSAIIIAGAIIMIVY